MSITTFTPPFLADADIFRFEINPDAAVSTWKGRVEVLAVMVTPGGWFSKGAVEFLVSDVETGRLFWAKRDEIKKVQASKA